MHSLSLVGAGLMLALAIPAAAADNSAPDARQSLSAAIDAYRKEDCTRTLTLAAAVVTNPAPLEDKDVSLAYDLAIVCALKARDNAKAGDYAQRAIDHDVASDLAWRIGVATDIDTKRYDAGLAKMERLAATGRGGTLNTFAPTWLLQLHRQLEQSGDNAMDLRLLAIIANRAYDPDDASYKIEDTGDYVRATYARKLLAAGKRTEAVKLLAELDSYDGLSQVALDPDLLAARGGTVDLRAAVEADLVRHRAMIERYPKTLAAIVAVASDLHRLGRNDETIALLKAAAPRLADKDAYEDLDEKLPWFWNALAYAYLATGKYDDMAASFRKGAALKEWDAPNVSQVINLAWQQVMFGRGKDALATLATLGDSPAASPYGLMQVHGVRGCALVLQGQTDKARDELAYAVAHEKDDPATVTSLDLCLGDEDAAAASWVRRLGNKDWRHAAMVELAEYDTPDPRAPVSPFAAHLERVRKRPEVVAAVRAAGGPVRIHLQNDPF